MPIEENRKVNQIWKSIFVFIAANGLLTEILNRKNTSGGKRSFE
jgi:hypothetical protein